MTNQLLIKVSQPSILTSLRQVLSAMEGVVVEDYIAETDWQDEPEVAASIARGEEDLANGRSVQMSAKDIRAMLGV